MLLHSFILSRPLFPHSLKKIAETVKPTAHSTLNSHSCRCAELRCFRKRWRAGESPKVSCTVCFSHPCRGGKDKAITFRADVLFISIKTLLQGNNARKCIFFLQLYLFENSLFTSNPFRKADRYYCSQERACNRRPFVLFYVKVVLEPLTQPNKNLKYYSGRVLST